MRPRTIGLGLAVALTVVPGAAVAHPLGIGVLVIEGDGPELALRLRVSPDEAGRARPELRLDGCETTGTVRSAGERDGTSERTVRARCAPDAAIEVDGLGGSGVRVLVVDRRRGADRRVFLEPERARYALDGDASGLGASVALGAEHVLGGIDHLLFVLGLLALARSRRELVLSITGFTIGHSITLALAALELVRVPRAPVEILIAVSLVLVALEVLRDPPRAARPELAAAFGLVHGLGFAGALLDLGTGRSSALPTLLGFNAGVEIGQLAFVAAAAVVALAARSGIPFDRQRALAAYVVGAAGVYLVLDRALDRLIELSS